MSRTPAELRSMVRKRDGDDCYLCDQLIDFTKPPGTWRGPSLEHVFPVAAGGSRTDPENLRLAHALPCNNQKSATYEGVDYSAQPVRLPMRWLNPNAVPAEPKSAFEEFESWSSARN